MRRLAADINECTLFGSRKDSFENIKSQFGQVEEIVTSLLIN